LRVGLFDERPDTGEDLTAPVGKGRDARIDELRGGVFVFLEGCVLSSS
jgi:hypothetical protein